MPDITRPKMSRAMEWATSESIRPQVDNTYFAGLRGLGVKENSELPEELSLGDKDYKALGLPVGYNSISLEEYKEKYKDYYDANPEFNPEDDYKATVIYDKVGKEKFDEEYRDLDTDAMVSKFNDYMEENFPTAKQLEERLKNEIFNDETLRSKQLENENKNLAIKREMAIKSLYGENFDPTKTPTTEEEILKLKDYVARGFNTGEVPFSAINMMGIVPGFSKALYKPEWTIDENYNLVPSIVADNNKQLSSNDGLNEADLETIAYSQFYTGKYAGEPIQFINDYNKKKQLQGSIPYFENPERKEVYDKLSSDLLKDTEDYADLIYKRLTNPTYSKYKYKALQEFEKIAPSIDNYYAASKDPNTSAQKGYISEDQKLNMMAKYYANLFISGLNQEGAEGILSNELSAAKPVPNGWEKTARVVEGIGADVYGTGLELAGMLWGLKDGIYGIFAEDELDDMDLSGWQKFLYRISDNTLVREGVNAIESGVAGITEERRKMQQANLKYHINKLDVSDDFIAQVIQQSGYTTASIFATFGAGVVAQAIAKGAGKATAKVATAIGKQAIKKTSREIAEDVAKRAIEINAKTAALMAEKLAGNAAKFTVVPFIHSYTEAVQDGFQVMDEVLESSDNQLRELAYNEFAKQAKWSDEKNSFEDEEFNNYYLQNSKYALRYKQLESLLNSLSKNIQLDNETGKSTNIEQIDAIINELNSIKDKASEEMNTLLNNYFNEKYEKWIDSDEVKKKQKEEAVRAFANTTTTDMAIISTSDLLLSNFFIPETKVLKKFGIKNNFNIKTVPGQTKVAASGLVKINPYRHFVTDILSEGYEEWAQHINSEVGKTVYNSDMQNFFFNEMHPESKDKLGYGILANQAAVFETAMEAAASDEAKEAFLMGSAGALLGAATGNINYKKVREKVERDARDFGYTKTEKVLATINEYWRSPLFYTFTDRRENIARTNRTISDINERFEKDAAFRNAYESSTGAIQYMNSFMKARQNDDAIGMEDSEFATHVENIAIMSQLRGTKLERRFNQALDEVANASTDDPATQELISQIRQEMNLEGSEMSDSDILNMIKGRISTYKNLIKEYTKEYSRLNDTYGEIIDDRTKRSIVYSKLTQANKEKMISSREQDIRKALSSIQSEEASSGLSKAQQNALARYGSLENAEKRLKYEKSTQSKVKMTKEELKQLKDDIKELKSIEGVLTAREILSLSPVERMEMLDKSNISRYSKEQREQIEKAKTLVEPNILTAIEEAGKLRLSIDMNNSVFTTLRSDTQNIANLSAHLEYNATLKSLMGKTEKLRSSETYEDFEKELNELKDSAALTKNEILVLSTFLKKTNNDFYNRYIDKERTTLLNKKILGDLMLVGSDVEKKTINAALNELISRGYREETDSYNYDDLISILDENGFRTDLKNRLGIDLDSWSIDELAKLKELADTNLKELNSATFNIQKVIKKMSSKDKQKDTRKIEDIQDNPSEQTKPENEEEESLTEDANDAEANKVEMTEDGVNKTGYLNNKNMYDSLFRKIASIIKGNKENLDVVELFNLLSLYTESNQILTSPSDIKRLFGSLSFDINSLVSVNNLLKEIRKRAGIYENTNDGDTFMYFLENLVKLRDKSVGKTPVQVLADMAISLNSDIAEDMKKENIEKDKQETKGGAIGNIDSVVLNILSLESALTEEQKKWYEDNNIFDNLKYIIKNLNSRNIRIILVKDQSALSADSTYDSDNLPLVALVRVGNNVKNSVTIDGSKYLKVGLVAVSRNNITEEPNALNKIRENMLPQEEYEDGMIPVRYSDDSLVEFAGWNINTNASQNTESAQESVKEDVLLMEYLIKKHNGNIDEALEDFRKNTKKVTYTYTRKTVDGAEVITMAVSCEELGVSIEKVVDKMPNGVMTDEYTWNGLAYYNDKDPNQVPNFVFVKTLDATSHEGMSLYDTMNSDDISLFNDKYDNTEFTLVRKGLIQLRNSFRNQKIQAKLMHGKTVKDIYDALNQAKKDLLSNKGIALYLNIKDFDIDFTVKGDDITILAKIGDDIVSYITINRKDLFSNIKQGSTNKKFQDLLKGIIFDEDGNFRKFINPNTGNSEFIVKQQVEVDRFKSDSQGSEKILNSYFYGNVLFGDGVWANRKIEGYTSNIIKHKDKKPSAPINFGTTPQEDRPIIRKNFITPSLEEVYKILSKFARFKKDSIGKIIEDKRDTNRLEGCIGVTSFIKKGNNKVDPNPATCFGTSIDFIIRLYFSEDVNRDPKKLLDIVEAAKNAAGLKENIMPGFTDKMLEEFVNNLSKLAEHLDNMGEKPIPVELAFKGEFKSESGKYIKLQALPDMVTVDANGDLHIYDFKSYNMDSMNSRYIEYTNSGIPMRIQSARYLDEHINEWNQQVSLYADIIEQMTGLKVKSIGIIPIPVLYNKFSEGTFHTSKDKIEFNDNYFVTRVDGKTKYLMNRTPIIYGDIIRMERIDINSIESDKWQDKLDGQQVAEGGQKEEEVVKQSSEPESIKEQLGNGPKVVKKSKKGSRLLSSKINDSMYTEEEKALFNKEQKPEAVKELEDKCGTGE